MPGDGVGHGDGGRDGRLDDGQWWPMGDDGDGVRYGRHCGVGLQRPPPTSKTGAAVGRPPQKSRAGAGVGQLPPPNCTDDGDGDC